MRAGLPFWPQFPNIDPMLTTCCQETFDHCDAPCGDLLVLIATTCFIHHLYATAVWLTYPHPFLWDPGLPSDNNLLWKRDRPGRHVTGRFGGEFICLSNSLKSPSKANNPISSVAFRRLLFRHYVYLHCCCEKSSKHSFLIPRDPDQC